MADHVHWIIGAIILAILGLVIKAGYEDQKRWDAFKTAHNCQIVGKMDGETFNTFGVSGNGQMTVGVGSTSSKTGWKCDDGITYWKES